VTRRHAFGRQRGQATTEMVIAALVLVPLMLLVPLLGRVVDLVQATEAASRYAVFEAITHRSGAAWAGDAALAEDVRRRFFNHPDAPVKTGDVAGDFTAHRNPLWSDHVGRPSLARLGEQVGVATRRDPLDTPAASYAATLHLAQDNLVSASVTVTPAGVPELPPFDRTTLRIARRTVLLTDPWTAHGNADVRQRIESAPRLYPVAAVRGLIDVAGRLPTLVLDPPLRVGEFDWDVVPCDRLIGGC